MTLKLIFLSFLVVISCCTIDFAAADCPPKKHVVCYWSSWAIYRPGNGAHNIFPHIIPQQCTHIVYSFAGLDLDGKIASLDPTYDLRLGGGYKTFMKLREKNPCVKLVLAIGGWDEGSEKYSLLAENEESRHKFADSVLRFLVFYNFDGLDFDWEYPNQRGGLPADKTNYIELLKVLHQKLAQRNRFLTAALPASLQILVDGFDIAKMCTELEFISLMAYDMHFTNMTSIQSPLKLEKDEWKIPTIDEVVDYLIINGCPANKIVLGIPAYGKTFTLKNVKNDGLRQAVTGLGKAGPYTKAPGFLGYNEICEYQKTLKNTWKITHLDNNAAVYASRDRLWISYDDQTTVGIKGKYVLDKGLAGLMFWSIDTDDFRGNCTGQMYPLLTAANVVLKNKF